MRKTLLLILALSFASMSFTATYTSAADGEWSTYTTWSPMGMPQPGDEVIINHNVIMDDAYTSGGYWSVNGGSITIGANSSLVQGTNVIGISIQNDGSITNNGTINFNQIGIYQGSFTNNGVANFYSLIYNLDNIENHGIVQEVDSFYNSGIVNNYSGSSISTDSTLNEGTIINEGDFISTYLYNTNEITNNLDMSFFDFTNVGTITNNATIIVSNDGTNIGTFINSDGANINLTRNFSNADTINHNALFINNGLFKIGDNWTNIDTTKGSSTGKFEIEEGTYNSGFMKGNFLFCDNTPTVTINPIIDYNTGTIDSNITYCLTNNIENTLVDIDFIIYPNPTQNNINISNVQPNKVINIIDVTGKLIKQINITKNNFLINISDLENGIYYITYNNDTKIFIKQ